MLVPVTLSASLYPEMPSATYFADPCPSPSLTQSVCKILLDQSPRHAKLAHPRLSPNFVPTEDAKFNIGNAAHRILIGRGKELAIIDASDWRTKDAKAARDEATAIGKVAILAHQHDTASAMALAAFEQLTHIDGCRGAFSSGMGEVVMVAQHNDTWLRSMADWMESTIAIFDYKTTGASAAPQDLPYRMADGGWDLQAAMQERILDLIEPTTAGRRKHYFVCQENYEPYALSVMMMPESVMTIGRMKLDAALAIWSECVETNNWPGYSRMVQQPAYPKYAEARVIEQLMGEKDGE